MKVKVLPLVLLPVALPAMAWKPDGPRPVKTYLDWIVGCDNRDFCTAIGLPTGNRRSMSVKITRSFGFDEGPSLVIDMTLLPPMRLQIDDYQFPDSRMWQSKIRMKNGYARNIIQLMARGKALSGITYDNHTMANQSLMGLTAALKYMDSRQLRTDSPSAIIEPGNVRNMYLTSDYSVQISRPPASDRPAAAADEKALPVLLGPRICLDRTETLTLTQGVRLDDRHSLHLLSNDCASGAYNRVSVALIVKNSGAVSFARFDYDPGMAGEGAGSSDVVNGSWNAKERWLETAVLTRSTGDCGRRRNFVWDGNMFRLAMQEDMPHCRGSKMFVRTFTAKIIDK